jgi:hypothetical protein
MMELVLNIVISNREGGDPSKRRDYLPADKQFLITRNGKHREEV